MLHYTRPGSLSVRHNSVIVMEVESDIGNMTLEEYLKYEFEKERKLWRSVRSKGSPSRMGAKNLKGMKQEEAWVEDCDEEEYELDGLSMSRKKSDDVGSVTFSRAEKEKEGVKQPLTSQAIHITPLDDDYVAPATILVLVEHLKEFNEEPLSNSLTTEDDECNPMSDMEELSILLVSWMVTDLEVPKTHTVGGVWSVEYMDHGFTKSMKELDRCYTMLQELRSVIVGGALIHKNHKGSKHEGRRIRPTIGDFGGNCASNQSPFNNGRIEECEEEKKEDRVPTTKIFRVRKILITIRKVLF
ncbi:hypothetical protein Tco_0418048 [Tanacetum coccineum]